MSIRIMSEVWEKSPYEHSLLLVQLALADSCNDEGYCWPSVARIAKKCRLDERYTRRLLNQLVEEGCIEKGLNEGKKGTNVYLVRSTPVKKDTPVNFTPLGKKDTPVSQTPSPRVSRPPEPSVEPSVDKNTKAKCSLEQAVEFFTELGLLQSDAEWFFYKCEGANWKNGGQPIKDWKATVRAWKAAGYIPSQKHKPVASRNTPLTTPAQVRVSTNLYLLKLATLFGYGIDRILDAGEAEAWESCKESVKELSNKDWKLLTELYQSRTPEDVKYRHQTLRKLLLNLNDALTKARNRSRYSPACDV